MEKIKAEDLDLYYGDFKALKNINIVIAQKEVTAFIGPRAAESLLCSRLSTG